MGQADNPGSEAEFKEAEFKEADAVAAALERAGGTRVLYFRSTAVERM